MQKRTVFVLFLLLILVFPCFGGCSDSKSVGPPPGRPNGFPNNIWYDAENKHPWTDVFDENYQIDYEYATGIHGEYTGNAVEHGALSCAVAANDRDKPSLFQMEDKPREGDFLSDSTGVEGFENVFDLKHDGAPSGSCCDE